MANSSLEECVKGGLGLELVRESVFTALRYQNRPDLLDWFYDLQQSLNAIHGFSILTAPLYYAYQIPDDIAAGICGTVGGMLVASAAYNLVRNSRSKRKK